MELKARSRASSTRYGEPGGDQIARLFDPHPTPPLFKGRERAAAAATASI